jgi:hypothetical protein
MLGLRVPASGRGAAESERPREKRDVDIFIFRKHDRHMSRILRIDTARPGSIQSSGDRMRGI